MVRITNPPPYATPAPAVFVDRDGTIIVEKNYLADPEGVELLPRAAEAIRLLNEHGYLVICASNQSGVARGYYTEEAVKAVNARLVKMLLEQGARLNEVFFCPHHPQADVPGYRRECEGRKPNVGMATQAMAMYRIDLDRSATIGDRAADVEFGKNLGVSTILVTTGYGQHELERIRDEGLPAPDFVTQNVYDAVQWILGRHRE